MPQQAVANLRKYDYVLVYDDVAEFPAFLVRPSPPVHVYLLWKEDDQGICTDFSIENRSTSGSVMHVLFSRSFQLLVGE